MLTPKINERIQQFITLLDEKKYTNIGEVGLEVFATGEVFRKPPVDASWMPIALPFPYGKDWTTYWFRTNLVLPREAEGQEVFFQAHPNADSLVFLNGIPSGAVNPFHEKIRLTSSGHAGERYAIHLECYSGHHYPGTDPFAESSVMLTLGVQIRDYPNLFSSSRLLIKNKAIYDFYYDVLSLFELARELDDNSLRKNRILSGLYEGLMKIRFTAKPEELVEQIGAASTVIAPLMRARNGDTVPAAYLVGHAHIDHAWLWPIWETERKIARTYANMARYSEEFPEFIFLQSQPCQLEIVEREYPEIFERVKAAYLRGQWEPNGGMWVEADCNITGGESLIRQFLVGKQASKRMLGYEGDVLWLPDVFGYAAALPQILAGCEIGYFVTSKINWNDTTRFPYDSFIWLGIDGTGVKTVYITARDCGYNGKVKASQLIEDWDNVLHKEVQDGIIKSIGEGDGGGGTMRSDLESARRFADLEGAPRTRWTKMSQALGTMFSGDRAFPQWHGELYLELHRGTYTTQARTKRYNRKLEFALRECEFLYSAIAMLSPSDLPYPREALLECWKKILTNQFHDIIPGSSITAVYKDAERWYREVEAVLNGFLTEVRASLAARLSPVDGAGRSLAVFNSLSWDRVSYTAIPWAPEFRSPAALVSGTESFPVQTLKNLEGLDEAIVRVGAPSMGMSGYTVAKAAVPPSPFRQGRNNLETPFYRVRFDSAGRFASLVDRETGREFVQPGGALNAFQSAEDLPVRSDAWDIDSDWTLSVVDENRLVSSEVVSDGPLFIRIRNSYTIGAASTLVQDVVFYAADRRIDFITRIDWHESHRVLKVAFPANLATDRVRCEVQYGHVFRNTHDNLPSDRAKFEICAHKWISVEESDWGMALLNDCKYGHDVRGSRMRLTLLRSPKAPDGEADMGVHRLTYSILPYIGVFSTERIVREAYDLNCPLSAVDATRERRGIQGFPVSSDFSFFSVDDPNVIIETVKLAENDDDAVIVRLYEAGGGARTTRLSTPCAVSAALETNMLERNGKPLAYREGGLSLEFRAFEIKTINLRLNRS
jgi:alpha-mannosidase